MKNKTFKFTSSSLIFFRVINKLSKYRAPDKLKKQIFNILVNNIESELIQQWNKHFEVLDTKGTGLVNIKELIKLIEKTGRFKSQLKNLKKLNKKDPHLKIKYSDFLLRVVDFKSEVKTEDIVHAFNHIDSDNSGKIDVKDLQSFLKRRGEDVSEEEAQSMLSKAEHKVALFNSESRSKKSILLNESEKEEQGKLDYPMFKTYLLAPSLESQGGFLMKKYSSIQFSEYEQEDSNSNDLDLEIKEDDQCNDKSFKYFDLCNTNDTINLADTCDFTYQLSP